MYRLLAVLALWPTLAAADWSPRPTMFSYDATFDLCTADPTAPDLAARCSEILAAAYVLKRAVARAATKCLPESLSTCTGPFADEGLPAIAAQIAVDVGCDATDLRTLPEDEPLPANHCITIASDIMIDEGVVPLDSDLACGPFQAECFEFTELHMLLWAWEAGMTTSDGIRTSDFMIALIETCTEDFIDVERLTGRPLSYNCFADGAARHWADLAQQNQQDQ
jgi:hypothetical protein